jgi:tRNA1Val (adenine37-N6)-methyltransferase
MSKEELFNFKQFSISHANSSMKVGTDAILLGSWVDVSETETILEIGTGCGIIALMLAQRSNAIIDAIDIDKGSIEEAASNFKNSPWPERLHAHHVSLQNFLNDSNVKYDLIVSNPPYFQNSLLPAKENLKFAKHNVTLSYNELLRSSAQLLNPNGRFVVILPQETTGHFIKLAGSSLLFLHHQLITFPTPNKVANRSILVFGLSTIDEKRFSSLIVRHENGFYSIDYKNLTKDFHPEFPK